VKMWHINKKTAKSDECTYPNAEGLVHSLHK